MANPSLTDELRALLLDHFAELRAYYESKGWGGRVGFGRRPAVIVIDLALGWTRPCASLGSDLDSVVEATVRILGAARERRVPVFFTTGIADPAEPGRPASRKFLFPPGTSLAEEYTLDPRLGRLPTEKLIAKPYASAFKGTHLDQMLATLDVDTTIVTGCSTGHCVYATCRDANERYHVIVPGEAVGDRSELMHEVTLLDIDLAVGDVVATDQVVSWLEALACDAQPA